MTDRADDIALVTPNYVRRCPGLKSVGREILAQIIQLAKGNRGCYATLSAIQEMLGGLDDGPSIRTIRDVISKAIERGLLTRVGRSLIPTSPDSDAWTKPAEFAEKAANSAALNQGQKRQILPGKAANYAAKAAKIAQKAANSAGPSEQGRTREEQETEQETPTVPSPKPEPETPAPKPPTDYGFDAFWKAYPRGDGKAKAREYWLKLRPNAELQARILAALERKKHCPDWVKDAGKFIPWAQRWINEKRWEDEQKGPVMVSGPPRRLTGVQTLDNPDEARKQHRATPEQKARFERYKGWRNLGLDDREASAKADAGEEPTPAQQEIAL